ncbi:heparan-alpha-glucosaminide N-acetyltransferase domain-containing protein [Pseudactinotalea suaedae]|uniref:heparan-alpha-glucosaminide N-acetyltransferase domain-containing protein n=1 Tax=Pseudactinotalea suaedae TaxID=1524924 RepID=UPI001390BC47|nr:heparan-alpha-glucosaminide N-acetyltransferase domain-containing protein [Pseudactinotalea suaedae]
MSTTTAPAPTLPKQKKVRIVGVDTARGLAILGMFVAHLGLERSTELFSTTGWFWIADGRPSALFATLAGAGLAFMTKRAYAGGDPAEYRTQRIRLLKRSAILLVLGWILTAMGTPVAIILGAYALLFVLAIPFLRLRPTALLAAAAAVALVMPTLVLLTRHAVLGGTSPDVYAFTEVGQIALIIPVVADLWSGYYPALSWLLYILVGLAVGRMPLQRWTTQLGLLVGGALVAAAGYLPGLALERSTTGLTQDLVTIEPHSNTSFEMIGNVGVAVAVLGLCLLLTTAVAPLRVILTPVSAMGALSLTVYSAHIVVIRMLGNEAVYNPTSNRPLIALVVGSMVFATVWQLTLGQGPLERLLQRMIKPPQPPQAPPLSGQPQQWAGQQQPWPGQQQPQPWAGGQQQPQPWAGQQQPHPGGQVPHPTAYPPPPPPR